MEIVKMPPEFRAGTNLTEIKKDWTEKRKHYPDYQYTLDLSDVIYMDSMSFRLVFDFLPMFTKVIPPKSQQIIDWYNEWLDSKKGLSKGN